MSQLEEAFEAAGVQNEAPQCFAEIFVGLWSELIICIWNWVVFVWEFNFVFEYVVLLRAITVFLVNIFHLFSHSDERK